MKRAVTDTGREIVFSDAPEKAGVNNLLEIYQLLHRTEPPRDRGALCHQQGLWRAQDAEVAEVIIEGLRPIRERYEHLIADPAELDRILDDGAQRARAVAGTESSG